MKRWLSLTALLVFSTLGGAAAQTLENGGFTEGKTGWVGDGTVVYLGADGAESATQTPGTTPALRIELNEAKWKEIKQRLSPKSSETSIEVKVQVKASEDFSRLEASRKYSDVDFSEGGSWGWSAEVYPKCDFLIRVKDSTWYYRPFKLTTGTWKTFSVNFTGLKARQREVSLLVPPGKGVVYIKGQ